MTFLRSDYLPISGVITVAYSEIDTRLDIDILLKGMPDGVVTKAKSFRFRKDAYAHIIGRLQLRALLPLFGKEKGEQVLLTDKGKPFIDDKNFHFNISHSEDLVVTATSNTTLSPIGIDIERVKEVDINDFKKLLFRIRVAGHHQFSK